MLVGWLEPRLLVVVVRLLLVLLLCCCLNGSCCVGVGSSVRAVVVFCSDGARWWLLLVAGYCVRSVGGAARRFYRDALCVVYCVVVAWVFARCLVLCYRWDCLLVDEVARSLLFGWLTLSLLSVRSVHDSGWRSWLVACCSAKTVFGQGYIKSQCSFRSLFVQPSRWWSLVLPSSNRCAR